MFNLLFAFFHLAALLAVLGYGVYSLVQGNSSRFALIIILLVAYYFFVLHKAVLKEIARRKSLKKAKS
jgi:hypothetical protein